MVVLNIFNSMYLTQTAGSLFLMYFILLLIGSLFYVQLTSRGLACLFILFLSISSVYYLSFFSFFVFENGVTTFTLYTSTTSWYNIPLSLAFHIDTISFFFIILVLIIGTTTNIYVLHYFRGEGQEDIFYLYLNWFIFGMLILVSAGNFSTLLLGWELIGLTSFLLINFWNERRSTLKAAFKAFTFNKISDFFLFSFCVLIWLSTHETQIYTINNLITLGVVTNSTSLQIATGFLIISASIKSAQIIGHLWLPDSMEAPVPASALIHSATLVSAGVYLLLRFDCLLAITESYFIINFLGALTAAYGGVVAASQTDVKKLLAYSTISHCGFLFVCISLQNFLITFLYLFLHGIFKALTFFCVGSFIRVAQSQDTRHMGLMNRLLPFDTILLITSVTNLAGLPFTFGAFYKHMFFLSLMHSNTPIFNVGLCYIGLLSSLIYAYKLVYYTAFDINKWIYKPNILKLQTSNTNFKKITFTTKAFVLAVTLLFCFSWFIYLFFQQWLLHWPIGCYMGTTYVSNFPPYWAYCEQLHRTQFIFFYSLFLLICVFLIIYEGRSSVLWQQRIWLLLFILLTCIFYFFFNKIFFLINT